MERNEQKPNLRDLLNGCGGELDVGWIMENPIIRTIIEEGTKLGLTPKKIDDHIQTLGWPTGLGQNVRAAAKIKLNYPEMWKEMVNSPKPPHQTLFGFAEVDEGNALLRSEDIDSLYHTGRKLFLSPNVKLFNASMDTKNFPLFLRELMVKRNLLNGRGETKEEIVTTAVAPNKYKGHGDPEYYNLLLWLKGREEELITAEKLIGEHVQVSIPQYETEMFVGPYLLVKIKNRLHVAAKSLIVTEPRQMPKFYKVVHIKDQGDALSADHIFIKFRQEIGPRLLQGMSHLGNNVGKMVLMKRKVFGAYSVILKISYNIIMAEGRKLLLEIDERMFNNPISYGKNAQAIISIHQNRPDYSESPQYSFSTEDMNKVIQEMQGIFLKIKKNAREGRYPRLHRIAGRGLIKNPPKRLMDMFTED